MLESKCSPPERIGAESGRLLPPPLLIPIGLKLWGKWLFSLSCTLKPKPIANCTWAHSHTHQTRLIFFVVQAIEALWSNQAIWAFRCNGSTGHEYFHMVVTNTGKQSHPRVPLVRRSVWSDAVPPIWKMQEGKSGVAEMGEMGVLWGEGHRFVY